LLAKLIDRKRPAPLGVAYSIATFWLQCFILQSSTTVFQSAEKDPESHPKTAWECGFQGYILSHSQKL